MMVGIKSRDLVTGEPKAEKGKTFGTVSTITTEANQDDDQVKHGTAANIMAKADHETTTYLELGYLMAKLDQIDKKLKHSEEDREVIKKELRYNKHEKRSGREFMCHTGKTRCYLEKLYITRQTGNGSNAR